MSSLGRLWGGGGTDPQMPLYTRCPGWPHPNKPVSGLWGVCTPHQGLTCAFLGRSNAQLSPGAFVGSGPPAHPPPCTPPFPGVQRGW